MGTNTTGDVGIYKPADDEENWGASVRASFDDIDTYITALKDMQFDEVAITSADATPSISGYAIVEFTHSSAQDIDDFDDGVDGQLLLVTAKNGNTTLKHDGTAIDHADEADITLNADDWVMYKLESTTWREVFRTRPALSLATGTIGTSQIATGAVDQAAIGADAVGLSELKYTSAVVSLSTTQTLGIGLAFCPLLGNSTSGGSGAVRFYAPNGPATGSLHLEYVGSSLADGSINYLTASPPYDWGGREDYGLFVWLLKNKSTGEIAEYQISEDPPWGQMHHNSVYEKGAPELVAMAAHPWHIAGIPAGHEVYLVDLGPSQNDEVADSIGVRKARLFMNKKRNERMTGSEWDRVKERAKKIVESDPAIVTKKKREWLVSDSVHLGESLSGILTNRVKSASDEHEWKSGVPEFDDVVKFVKV